MTELTGKVKRSSAGTKLMCAMQKAQHAIDRVTKDASNPFFKSKYANLESVWGVIQPALIEHGLSCHIFPKSDAMRVMILHESGDSISIECGLPPLGDKITAQSYGSAITYGRRYILQSIWGVCPEDDDGNAASNKSAKVEKKSAISSKLFADGLISIFNDSLTQVALSHEYTSNAEDIDHCQDADIGRIREAYRAKNETLKKKADNDA